MTNINENTNSIVRLRYDETQEPTDEVQYEGKDGVKMSLESRTKC